MASGSALSAYHSTLAADTVDTVTLTAWSKYVRIINKSDTYADIIYVTTNGTVPTVGGAETIAVRANTEILISNEGPSPEPSLAYYPSVVVKLISAGTPDYSVASKGNIEEVSASNVPDGAISNLQVAADAAISPSKIAGTAVVTNDARLSDTRTPTDNTVSPAKMTAEAKAASNLYLLSLYP